MTLDQFNQQISDIQQVAASDPEEAIAKNKAMFITFAEQDSAFVVLDGSYPLSAPAQDNDPRLFLRVFSHEEAALAFVEKRGEGQVTAIDGVELMQLAKSAFLRGVYGFLLNDGYAWAILSFPDFLLECFRVVLGTETMYNEDYVTLIQLINMVRRNDFYKIKAAHLPDSAELYFLDPAAQDSDEFASCNMEELSSEKLLQMADKPGDASIHIRIGKTDCIVRMELLQAAMRLTHLGDTPPNDFHTDSLSLDFRAEDFVTEAAPVEENTGETTHKGKKHKRVRTPRPPREKRKKQPREGRSGILKPLITVAIGALAILAFAALLLGGFFARETPLESLQTDISTQYYSSVAEHYAACKENGTDKEAQEIMLGDLNAKFQAYVAGECEAQELKDVMDVYASIDDMEEEAEKIYSRAAAVELSKKAYLEGLATESVSGRLELWRKVTMDDTDNYSAMLENLSDHALEYKYIIFIEATALPEPDALSRLILLQSFYPGDVDISAKIRAIQTGALVSEPNSEQPAEVADPTRYISISRVATHGSGWNEEMDLFIDWTNTSGREIQEVDFEVIPYDSAGKQASTKVMNEDGQYYSRYLARDVGPFDTGYSTPSNHHWENAWVNSSIASVAIDKVSILFVGEETPTIITDASEISALFD